jgi:hypothetical protein
MLYKFNTTSIKNSNISLCKNGKANPKINMKLQRSQIVKKSFKRSKLRKAEIRRIVVQY